VEFAGDLGSRPRKIFFTAGLDHPNQIESAGEIRFLAQGNALELAVLLG
jgi:hypothetical protein